MHNKIVIVDDEPMIVKLLRALLSDFNCEIHDVNDSERALATIEEVLPDLVLLDVQMPHISGLDIAKAMRENDNIKHIPIIFVTSRSDVATMQEGFKYNAVDYLTKPISFKQLTSSVQKALNLKNIQS